MNSVPGLPLSANVTARGVRYRAWTPTQEFLRIEIQRGDGTRHVIQTQGDAEGYHEGVDPKGMAGDLYHYRLANGNVYADPASRAQNGGVFGESVVIDPTTYPWKDQAWVRPPFRDIVIYEIHVGTFTTEGTFKAIIARLPYLRDLGINAIELMPIAAFPGGRNWGYDGVLPYAPAGAYGTPDDLRALVDAAHAQGIAVILDVVYNHFGPAGNPLYSFSAKDYYREKPETPWGASFNFDGPNSKYVREFFACNSIYWMEEFHVDGFRLDATHWIHDSSPTHILAEITANVHARGGYVVAEDERNEARLIEPPSKGGFGFDAVWADDFHHSIRVSQTKEQHAYLQDFSGTLEETVDTLQHGWRFRGQLDIAGRPLRGSACEHIDPSGLIHCISNHDQAGNRALGDRLSSSISPASYRAISMLLCLTPYIPMIFMGQDWAATSPFLFFTDHDAELGKLITEGRKREFVAFPEFNNPDALAAIPDPQALATFVDSKLKWNELSVRPHSGMHALYRACLRLRQAEAALRPPGRTGWEVGIVRDGVGFIRFTKAPSEFLLLFHLWPREDLTELDLNKLPWTQSEAPWEMLLSSNAIEFDGTGTRITRGNESYVFGEAETLLLRAKV